MTMTIHNTDDQAGRTARSSRTPGGLNPTPEPNGYIVQIPTYLKGPRGRSYSLFHYIQWPCPACGGRLHDAVYGRVPGDHWCECCGLVWHIGSGDLGDVTVVRLSIPRIAGDEGGTEPEWSYRDLPCDDDTWEEYRRQCTFFGVRGSTRDIWTQYRHALAPRQEQE
jgi:hypothetical protein